MILIGYTRKSRNCRPRIRITCGKGWIAYKVPAIEVTLQCTRHGRVDVRRITCSCSPISFLQDQRQTIVENACPGPGACGGMYTANTMASAIEVGSPPAAFRNRQSATGLLFYSHIFSHSLLFDDVITPCRLWAWPYRTPAPLQLMTP